VRGLRVRAFPLDGIQIAYDASNVVIDHVSAPASATAFFLSTDAALDTGDVMVGSRSVPALAPGASSTATSSVPIPAGIGGNFYLIALANADAGVGPGTGGNNVKSRAIRIGPDFTVSSVTSPGSARAGATIAVTDTTRNTASVAAPASTTRYFLSTTPVLNGAAIPVGARAVPALAAAGSSSGPGSVTIPAGLAAGTYYLVAKSDGDDAVAELSETNNTRYRPLDVLP
jgi:large repetitive protein